MFRRSDQAPAGSSRRQFLKRAGVTGALSAAVLGGAEVAGLSSAFASTRNPKRPRSCNGHCTYTYTPYKCNGGKACPSGECCFYQSCEGTCGTSHGYGCRAHGCSNYETCCP
jgi:anaerobic selenocysteine-containing dehydrogenase